MTTLRPGAAPALWKPRQVRSLYLLHAVALALLVIASLGARNSGDFSTQTDWVVLAVAGLLLGGLASAAWLLTGRREVGRRRILTARYAAAIFASTHESDPVDPLRVASAPMRRYHRAECPLVEGKNAAAAPIVDHQRAGRTPCAVCEA